MGEGVLEVRPPPGSGGKVLTLKVLGGVSLRVSLATLSREFVINPHVESVVWFRVCFLMEA